MTITPEVLSVTILTLVDRAAAETVDTFRKEDLEVQGMVWARRVYRDRERHSGYTGIIAGGFHFLTYKRMGKSYIESFN